MEIKVGILTVSDKGARGERVDESGRKIKEELESFKKKECSFDIKKIKIVSDDKSEIKKVLLEWSKNIDLILTTGGTGFSIRDITPEATGEIIERECPGLSEAIRRKCEKRSRYAILSRGIAGIRGNTLIVNLPGSPKGAIESLKSIITVIPHGIAILRGEVKEHIKTQKSEGKR